MPMLTAAQSLAQNGPCRVVDGHGDYLLGSITSVDLETGDYVVACIDDDGKFVSDAPAPNLLGGFDSSGARRTRRCGLFRWRRLPMLFDTSPQEDQDSSKKRKGRKRQSSAAPPSQEPRNVSDALAAILARPAVVLGKMDDVIACERCDAACMDIVEDAGREWQIECCFCGRKEWIAAMPAFLPPPKPRGFVFNDGRFAGKTVEEAFVEPRGRDYVEWAAREHKRPSVREACQKFLLTAPAAVG